MEEGLQESRIFTVKFKKENVLSWPVLLIAATTVEREELDTERPADSSEIIKVFILPLLLRTPCLCPFKIHVLKLKPSVMVFRGGPSGGDEIMGVETPSEITVITKKTSRSFHHVKTQGENAV